MNILSVLDTSIANYNLGNQIIMDSVYKNIHDIFKIFFLYKIPYMDLTDHSLSYIKKSSAVIFGGTNSLCGEMEKYTQWGVNKKNIEVFEEKVILMGLGWWQYQDNVSSYTRNILHRVLNLDYLSSVRDQYTADKLKKIGFDNIINTGCPTLWELTQEHCRLVPDKISSETALITITDYNKNRDRDIKMIEIVKKHYKNIVLWPQGVGDIDYFLKNLESSQIKIIHPNLNSFDSFLIKEKPDYIGTRLHGGIRALQNKCRAIIISIDNRAIEMGKDFNLPVIDISKLEETINKRLLDIKIPLENILIWKKQFSDFQINCDRKVQRNIKYKISKYCKILFCR